MSAKRLAGASVALCAFLVGGASGVGAAPAAAATECGARTTQQAFAMFDDTNEYFVVGNGDFEAGDLTGWTGRGLSVVVDNEPWRVLGAGHTRSARLGPKGVMYADTFCSVVGEDSLRLFVRRPGVAGATLRIVTTVRSDDELVVTTAVKVDGSVPGWAPSPRLLLEDVYDGNGQQQVSIMIQATGTAATWGIDDVMVDPWRTR